MSPRTVTVAGSVLQVVESCAYRWMFDTARRRFRREPRRSGFDDFAAGGWQPYEDLTIDRDRDCFVVVLNADRTRLLSAEGHDDDCSCGAGVVAPPAPH